MKRTIILTTYSLWSLLGGYRNIGANNYIEQINKEKAESELRDFTNRNSNSILLNDDYYKKRVKELQQNIDTFDKPSLFVDRSTDFVIGTILYAAPFTGIYCVPAELYRLEVNIRQLEQEKKSKRYNLNWFNTL